MLSVSRSIGGRFLAYELLQVLVGLPAGLEGGSTARPHRPIGFDAWTWRILSSPPASTSS